MNPDTCIKNWLLAVGDANGIRQAHDHRWPDADTRQVEPYFTYRITNYTPDQLNVQDMTSRVESVVTQSAWQSWIATVLVDLYNCPDGMYVLASCLVALRHNQTIRALFSAQSCGYVDSQTPNIVNLSTWDDAKITDHHQVTVRFQENVYYEIDETNTYVDRARISFDVGGDTIQANASIMRMTAATGTIEITGLEAELTES